VRKEKREKRNEERGERIATRSPFSFLLSLS